MFGEAEIQDVVHQQSLVESTERLSLPFQSREGLKDPVIALKPPLEHHSGKCVVFSPTQKN